MPERNGLDRADVEGPDYPSETFLGLKEKEIRQYGEFRSRASSSKPWTGWRLRGLSLRST